MERCHIYKLGLAILFYMVYCGRKSVVNSLKVDDVTSTSNTTDYRERRDSGDDNTFFNQGGDGTPGVDYPTLSYVPRTKFSCRDMEAGYYADLETDCQVFHICDEGRKLSFLCPNGTIFQQGELICDWWFKVNCSTSPFLYEESAEILHRESAKRKESRRYHGTKQGVFSSKEDYDYKDFKDFKIHGTPSHFVTPSYPHKVSLKSFDNSISASTEGSIRRNYNIRGDRKLDSIGNGVKESTSRFSSGNNENAFSINLQEKSGDRGRTTIGTNLHEIGDRQNTFGIKKTESIQQKTGNFGFGQSSQQRSRNQDRFNTNFQEKVVGSGKDSFNINLPEKSTGFGQTKVTATSRSTFGVNLQGNQERFSQTTFGTSAQRDQEIIGSSLEEKATTPTSGNFGSNVQRNRFSQTAFGANIQRNQNVFGSTLEGKGTAPTQSSFGGQLTFGRDNQIKQNGAGQLPLGRSSEVLIDHNQSIFGTKLQEKANTPKQSILGTNLQLKANNRDQKLLDTITERGEVKQTSYETSAPTTVLQQKAEDHGQFGQFGVNTGTRQRFGGSENIGFGSSTEKPFRGRVQNKLTTSFQGGVQFNRFGTKTDVNPEQTISNTRVDDRNDKIKFSISSRDQFDRFGQTRFDTNKRNESGEIRINPGAHTPGLQRIQDVTQNRFDTGVQDTSKRYEQTTSRLGLTFKEKGYTTEAGKLFVSTTSGETQEPQETASFIKNLRNNVADTNIKQSTINLYPNHRESYSEIKDIRHYHERPQSKLPEKPFYGSSIGPLALSTVPVSAQTGSYSSTTEASSRGRFGFRSDASTVQPKVNGQQQFSIYRSNEPKTSTTTRKFGFGLQPTQQANTGNNVNVYNKGFVGGVDISLNSVSSTLQPDFAEQSKGKSSAFPETQRTSYYDDKLSRISGRTGIDSSTPAVRINTHSYTKVPTTENVRTDSPIIKLNIIPSTALPGFESTDRTGKAFSIESPKTQIIQGFKASYTKIPLTIPRREYDGSTLSVGRSSKGQGFRSTPAINEFTFSNPTVSSSYLEGKTESVFPTASPTVFGVTTNDRLTPSFAVSRFGNVNIGTTPSPVTATNKVQFTINEEEHSTPSLTGDGSVDLSINNQSYTLPTTTNININTDATSSVTDNSITTTNLGTEKDVLKVTINDGIYSTTPSSESTETVDFNINDQSYSTPTSQFAVTGQTGFGITATTATPFEDQTTQNILYTSPSSVLQPKPFSFPTKTPSVSLNSITPSASFRATLSERSGSFADGVIIKQPGLSQLPAYKLSSASPFIPVSKPFGDFGSKTPVPTLPTPFTTVATLLHRTKPIDENVSNMINTLIEAARQRFGSNDTDNGFGTPRPGLVVPPSAGPQTLHTLAIYFANALDNLTASSPREQSEHVEDESETDSPIIHIDNDELIRSLLTQMTLDHYEGLFKEKDPSSTAIPLSLRTAADDSENDLIREDTKYPVEGPPVRQLARVFTEALSAYLDDPDTFRKVLHDVRPTEPPQTTANGENVETEEDEVLNYSDSDLKSDHPHLPTRPTGIPVSPTWGYILAFNNSLSNADSLESRNSLSSDNENLQSADSQSFVSQLNKVTKDCKTAPTTTVYYDENTQSTTASYTVEANALKTLPEDHWTSSLDVTKLWQTTLLVNPATLNDNFDTTKAGQNVDLPSTQLSGVTSSEETSSEASDLTTVSEIQYELRSLPKLELNSTQVHGILIDFMHANKTEGSAKLQRILHKLNISQDEFLDKMKEIEGNPLTRRLILLLISECKTDKNRELETRSAASDGIFGAKINTEDVKSTSTGSRHDGAYTESVGEVTESNLFKQIVHPSLEDGDEDTRALELLNSLYVIASKFGK